jgi:hypothetical protein
MPELILFAEPQPATYHQSQVETLRRHAPLAQLVVVAGTWCEGELRTGKPHPGVLRLYWHEFAHWWHLEAHEVGAWRPCLDGPMNPRSCRVEKSIEISIAIHATTWAAYEAIAASLSACGANCRWVRGFQVPKSGEIGVWDGGQLDASEWQRLEGFATSIRQKYGSLVVLLDFPRKEHISRLKTLGCEVVFGKPCIVAEVVAAIAHLAGPTQCNPWV